MKKASRTNKGEDLGFSAKELRALRALKTPAKIQKLVDALEY
jgi:hypothetical protein